jgi:eukaryotic-like serine/threonine-protein kinase
MAAQVLTLPGRYRDPKPIARGGMGEVYCAVDTVLGRPVAVKVLAERYAVDPVIRKRFRREALAAARLSGEANIVTIYDVDEWGGRPFIVMEYIPCGSLEDELKNKGAQPPGRVLQWLEQAARALDHAHLRGVVHRDVKPANLLLDKGGVVHVADFGVATAAGLATLTQTGTVLGTAGYLAPEQAEGRAVTPAADRYALGVVAFELLTGSRPFRNDSIMAEAAAHAHAPVPSISERGRGIPREADAVFERALAKDPADRFFSCEEFIFELRAAFDAAAGETLVAARPTPRAVRRQRTMTPALLTALALALGGGVAAAVVATRSGGAAGRAVTVTEPGTTLRETVTAQAPKTSSAPPSTSATSAGSSSSQGASGSGLALEGYRRLQAGDAASTLPLLQQAAQKLQGTNSLSEAYNDYNLALALAQTRGCSSQVVELLNASAAIQGNRSEIEHLRHACNAGGGH